MLRKHLLIILVTTLVSSLLFWLIFASNLPSKIGFGNTSMETIFANYDGPNYLIVSKCWYNKPCIGSHFSLPQPLEYYPAHLPGYPLLISIFSIFVSSPWAMLLTTLVGSVLLNIFFYKLSFEYFDKKTALVLTIIFNFFPARLFILRQIGAPETWFLFATIASLYYFKKDRIWLSAFFAAGAQAFKSPGVLLLVAYFIFFIKDRFSLKKYYPFTIVPLTVFIVFYLYYLTTGDFMAYFHSGDNFHLNPLPYTVFISTKSWINSIWLEDIVYIYFLALAGIQLLLKEDSKDPLAYYGLVFLVASLMVAHRDISRYIAPLYPLLIIAYGKYLSSKISRIALLLLLPAIILYAINFVVGNAAPIADWTSYL